MVRLNGLFSMYFFSKPFINVIFVNKCFYLFIHSFICENQLLHSLTYKYKKYCFWVKFSNWKFWWIYTFWGLLNPKITFLTNGLSVCVCVYLCVKVCYQHNSKTNYSRNIKFGILHLYHIQMLLESFQKDRTKILSTRAHKSILIH